MHNKEREEIESRYVVGVWYNNKFIGYIPSLHRYNAHNAKTDINSAHVSNTEYTGMVCDTFIDIYKEYPQYMFKVLDVNDILTFSEEKRKNKESLICLLDSMMNAMGYNRVEESQESQESDDIITTPTCGKDIDYMFMSEDEVTETELGMDIYAHTYAEYVLECIMFKLRGDEDELDCIKTCAKDIYDERLELEELFRCRFDGVSLYKYKY